MNDSRNQPDTPETENGRHRDPLRHVYHESIVDSPEYYEKLISRDAALLCIDLQYLDAVDGHGVFAEKARTEAEAAGRAYYFKTLNEYVLDNVRKLQEGFRDHGMEVIHVRIQALTRNGRDRSGGHKRLALLAPPGSRDADFVEQVAPLDDEIVINKTASGVFSSTNLHYVLRNVGISSLYVTGVYTNECVETTVRDACDLGYTVTMIDDACTTVTPELHEASLKTLRDRYCRVLKTEEALHDIARYVPPVTRTASPGDRIRF